MLSKIACLNRWKVANGCTCMLFSTVSSNCLPEQMQSRIYCTCMLFLSDFSHVSSSCLPVQMQSRIGCICTFFSRVSFQMCPQIACLDRCIFALVAFVRFFTRVSFHVHPQITCPNSCKITLVAFV